MAGRAKSARKAVGAKVGRVERPNVDDVRHHLSALVMEHRSIDALIPNRRNARTHSARQVSQLAASIKAFGFLVPALIDQDGNILAGHGRIEAARSLDLKEVPVCIVSHLTPVMKRMFAIADNRLAELAGWDEDLLRAELEELSAAVGFDVEITGFDSIDIDRICAPNESESTNHDDVVDPVEPGGIAISRPGDVWQLGRHRLLCANALDPESWRVLMEGNKAQLAFTDPPYNVKIDGHVSGLGSVKHREFVMAAGDMTPNEFTSFLAQAFARMAEHSRDGSIHFICMDWRHQKELLDAALSIYGDYKNLCVWNKTNAGMGSFYRSQHELVHVFKVGNARHINNFGLGEKGRYRTNVWTYAGVNTFRRGRDEELSDHPTPKPVLMVMDALRDCSNRGDIVIDPFGGSGTTLIAAERARRFAYLMEIDPLYVDSTIRRWEKATGETARLAATGATFEDVAAGRQQEPPSNLLQVSREGRG